MNIIDQAIESFAKKIRSGYELCDPKNVKTNISDNGIYLEYVGNGMMNTYSAKVNSNSENYISDFNVKIDQNKKIWTPSDND